MPGQFLVPQFIDVETKIIGPVTTRQFFIMMGDAMVCFLFYKLFYFNTFIVVTILTTVVFGVVAFARINGMPFHYFFLNMVQTLKRPKLRVWAKVPPTEVPEPEKAEEVERTPVKPPLATSRLADLSLLVDTGGAYEPEKNQ